MRPSRIAVIGMGRSGTSKLMEMLTLSGLNSLGIDGKYEHPGVRGVNDALLQQEFGARRGLPYGRLPAGPLILKREWHMRADRQLAAMDEQARRIGVPSYAFKDPRVTVLGEMWLPHCDAVIGIVRHPSDVMRSYINRKWIWGFNRQHLALNYWSRFNVALLRTQQLLQSKARFWLLDYNSDMNVQYTRLCAELGLDVTLEILSLFREKPSYNRAPICDPATLWLYETLRERCNLLDNKPAPTRSVT